MKKISIFPLLCFVSVSILTSCADCRVSTADYTVDWDNAECTPASLADIYSEIEFIPLENKRECMLSNMKSMSVTDRGIVVYHRTPLPAVALFDSDGQYVRNIGSLGHARSEYQDNVVCVASSPSGDAISVVTYEGVNVYDGEGRYVWSMTQTDDFMKNVVWTPKGYAIIMEVNMLYISQTSTLRRMVAGMPMMECASPILAFAHSRSVVMVLMCITMTSSNLLSIVCRW